MKSITEKNEGKTKVQIIPFRAWSMAAIMGMCVEHRLYTHGSLKQYTEMLQFVDGNEPTDENIYKVASNILDYTDANEDQTVTNIMYFIENEAVRTTFEIR